MNPSTDIKPLSQIKAHAAEIINAMQTTQRPLIITQHGQAKAVLLDTQTYHSLTETIALLKILNQSEREFAQGKTKTTSEVFAVLRKKHSEK